MKTTTLKNKVLRNSLLVAMGLILAGNSAYAQTTVTAAPIGVIATNPRVDAVAGLSGAITNCIIRQAGANGYMDPFDHFLRAPDTIPLLHEMVGEFLASKQQPVAIPESLYQLQSLSRYVAQQLAAELLTWRSFGMPGCSLSGTILHNLVDPDDRNSPADILTVILVLSLE